MKRKFLICLIGYLLAFSLVGCNETTFNINVEDQETLYNPILGRDGFILIGNSLYYDSATRIVYIKNGNTYGSVYTAYYAPNGLPYRYNPETNTFEEIKNTTE